MLLVGMSPRDSAALGVLVGFALKGWECEATAPQRGRALPAADLYVVDLQAIGLGSWSVAAEAQLLQLLSGRSAVLLCGAGTGEAGWRQVQAGHQSTQVLVHLAKPYSSEAMRQALKDAVTPRRTAAMGRPPVMAVRPVAPAAAQASARPAPVADRAGAPTMPTAPVARAACTINPAGIDALWGAFPQLARHAVLVRVVDALASGTPQELRLSMQHSVVLHPREGWAASNASMAVLERACRHDELAAVLSLRELSDEQAADRVQRIGAQRKALDPFLWALATAALGAEPLRLARDAQLTLKGFPDYTRLASIPDFFIQLAAICVRLPHTLSGLQAAFPTGDPQQISRFAFLCAASGLGQLSLVSGSTPPKPRAAVRRAVVQMPVKRGFFAAMLQKLF